MGKTVIQKNEKILCMTTKLFSKKVRKIDFEIT
jgi:hypothetical protein